MINTMYRLQTNSRIDLAHGQVMYMLHDQTYRLFDFYITNEAGVGRNIRLSHDADNIPPSNKQIFQMAKGALTIYLKSYEPEKNPMWYLRSQDRKNQIKELNKKEIMDSFISQFDPFNSYVA